jgi:hypothetical protein
MQTSKQTKNALGYFFIAGIWAVFLALGAFFFGVFAIYADFKSPHTSFLSRRLGLESVARRLYWTYFRPGWQDGKGYTQFDPALVYIPRPGKSGFRSPDFDVTLTFAPDTTRRQPPPADPSAPLVIVAGDSYAMGWGVQDNETYSYLLATRYGWNTINTGVPGYGAPRELLRMQKLGLLKRSTAIVIDFAIKDPKENRAYLDDPPGFIAKKNAAELWRNMQHYHQQTVSFPSILQFTCWDFRDQFKSGGWAGWWSSICTGNDPFGKRVDVGFSGEAMVGDFLKVLGQFPELRGKPVIVLEIDDYGSHSDFMPQLQRVSAQYPGIVPLPIAYERADFFRFDNHLNAVGHDHVARCVNQALISILHPAASKPN